MTDRNVPEIPYRQLAEIYDRLYSWKEYEREARIVRSLVDRATGARADRTLLDVGCGTGAHLRHLSRWYRSTGLDPSRPMLTVARRNVPAARFVPGAMPHFRLKGAFDAITCLFSAVGYLPNERALRATARTFASHLVPGGIAIVEPWFTPEAWQPGSVHLSTVASEEMPIARMNYSLTRRGRSRMDMHYLVPRLGRVFHWVERHEMSLFSDTTMRSAFVDAGLSVRKIPSRFYPVGRSDRGLWLAQRPLARSR